MSETNSETIFKKKLQIQISEREKIERVSERAKKAKRYDSKLN
jgi:hypothetical protein